MEAATSGYSTGLLWIRNPHWDPSLYFLSGSFGSCVCTREKVGREEDRQMKGREEWTESERWKHATCRQLPIRLVESHSTMKSRCIKKNPPCRLLCLSSVVSRWSYFLAWDESEWTVLKAGLQLLVTCERPGEDSWKLSVPLSGDRRRLIRNALAWFRNSFSGSLF